MPNMHHAIYIPAKENIHRGTEFTGITFEGENAKSQKHIWGSNRPKDQSEADAIIKQKEGYTQIAGRTGTATKLLKRMLEKQKNRKSEGYTVENSVIYQSECGGALAGLTNPRTVLYIDSHGSSITVGFRPYGFDPEQLAKLMAYERLPKNIEKIKIFACYSGERQDIGDEVRTGDIFACQFSAWMNKLGYHGLKTYGYIGEVKVDDLGHKTSEAYFSAADVKASAARREFMNGTMTSDATGRSTL